MNTSMILKIASQKMHSKFNFFEMTLQIEEFQEQMDRCEQCQDVLTWSYHLCYDDCFFWSSELSPSNRSYHLIDNFILYFSIPIYSYVRRKCPEEKKCKVTRLGLLEKDNSFFLVSRVIEYSPIICDYVSKLFQPPSLT